MLSSPKEAYHQHNDCYDEQNMDKPAHRVTAYQPQQPEYHEYHKDRPDHCNLLLLYEALPHVCIFNTIPYLSPKGMVVGWPSPLLQKVNPGCQFYEKFYRNRFRSVSNESSRREMSVLSSYVVYLPSSVIRKYSRRMESSLA